MRLSSLAPVATARRALACAAARPHQTERGAAARGAVLACRRSARRSPDPVRHPRREPTPARTAGPTSGPRSVAGAHAIGVTEVLRYDQSPSSGWQTVDCAPRSARPTDHAALHRTSEGCFSTGIEPWHAQVPAARTVELRAITYARYRASSWICLFGLGLGAGPLRPDHRLRSAGPRARDHDGRATRSSPSRSRVRCSSR